MSGARTDAKVGSQKKLRNKRKNLCTKNGFSPQMEDHLWMNQKSFLRLSPPNFFCEPALRTRTMVGDDYFIFSLHFPFTLLLLFPILSLWVGVAILRARIYHSNESKYHSMFCTFRLVFFSAHSYISTSHLCIFLFGRIDVCVLEWNDAHTKFSFPNITVFFLLTGLLHF